MNFWREDPEGMDGEIVKAMIALGYATKQDDEGKIVDRFNSPEFEKTNGYIAVATAAEESYTENLVSGTGPVAEGNR